MRPRRQHMRIVFLDAHHLDRRTVRNFRKNPPPSARPIPQIDDSPSAGIRHKHRQNTLRPIRRPLRKQNDFVFAAVPRQHIPLQLIRHTNMRKGLTRTILHTFEHFDGRSAEIHHPNIGKRIRLFINSHHAVHRSPIINRLRLCAGRKQRRQQQQRRHPYSFHLSSLLCLTEEKTNRRRKIFP